MNNTATQDNAAQSIRNIVRKSLPYGVKSYRLAKDGAFQVVPFGPLMSLAMAEKYQGDLSSVFPSIMVINVATQ